MNIYIELSIVPFLQSFFEPCLTLNVFMCSNSVRAGVCDLRPRAVRGATAAPPQPLPGNQLEIICR